VKVSFGIIGCGGIARKFADAVLKTSQTELYAVAAREKSRAEAFAKCFGNPKAYGCYEELMNDPKVDVIYVAVTHNAHYQVVKDCLLHHKNVLCEKPLVMTKPQAEELYQLAKENHLLLVEAMWTRMLPPYQKAKEWVKEGRIGRLKMIDAAFCIYFAFDPLHRLYNPDLGGGALFDLGVYPIEFITGITEQSPVSISSSIAYCETGTDETSVISMLFPDGAVGTASCSCSTVGSCDAAIYGSEGYITFPHFYDAQVCKLYNQQNELIDEFECPCENGFVYEAAHVRDLFLNGETESPLIPMKDTILTAEIFDTALDKKE
jgi:predicted dehydrogenase